MLERFYMKMSVNVIIFIVFCSYNFSSILLMAGCQEAFDPENSEFRWQNAQAGWVATVNQGWGMSFYTYKFDTCTCTYMHKNICNQTDFLTPMSGCS